MKGPRIIDSKLYYYHYYLLIIMLHLNFLLCNNPVFLPVLHNILEKQPYESQRLKWIPTRVRGRLLKNRAVRDSKTATRQRRAALEPPAATMETTRRKCVAAILNRPPAYPSPASMERHCYAWRAKQLSESNKSFSVQKFTTSLNGT